MKIILTGATGCLGSHIAKRFVQMGYDVIGLKRSFSDMWRISKSANDIEWVNIDIDGIERAFKNRGHIDAVVHMATSYDSINNSASKIVNSNIAFPIEVLQCAIRYNVDVFYNTDTFYNADESKYITMYSLSKCHFSEWGKWFSEQGEIEFLNLRIDHMYGDNDADYKFIPFLIQSFFNNVPSLNLTAGDQKRDFIYVDDVVDAYLTIMNQPERLSRYDVGSGNFTTIRELVEMIKKMTGASTYLKFGAIPYRKYEVMEPTVDITPLRKIGWKPKFSLEEGLRKTISSFSKAVI